jgi:hypothetical protein
LKGYDWRRPLFSCVTVQRMRHLIPALTLARNLVLGNSNDRRIWPEGGGFLNRCSELQSGLRLILQDLSRAHSRDDHVFLL